MRVNLIWGIILGSFWDQIQLGVSMLNLADVPCGIQKKDGRNPKIVANFLSRPTTYHGEFPWMVSFKYREGLHFCGGFIIHQQFVLSAAHCFNSIQQKFSKLSMMTATLGEHHHFQREDPVDALEVNLTKLILHPKYDPQTLSHDIVLLKLEKAIAWNAFVQPLCLPEATEDHSKIYEGTITGWGQTGEKQPPSDVLLQATVPVLDNPTCQQYFDLAKFKFQVNDFQFCAGRFFGGVDACWGDSGGPLMVREGEGRPPMKGVGIVSLGKGCGRVALPGIYTKVQDYVSWIREQVNTQ